MTAFAQNRSAETPKPWIREIPVGLLIGFLSALFAVSHAALVFTGPLAPWLPIGIAAAVTACIGLMLGHAALGSVPYGIGATDSSSISIMAVVVGGAVAALPPGTSPQMQLATAIGMTAGTVAITGLLLVGFGMARLGRMARFLPYPVVGGFMGGSGVLVLKGGASSLAIDPLALLAGSLPSETLLLQWAAAAIAVAVLWFAARRKHSLSVPIAILLLVLTFHGGFLAAGFSTADARASGWLPPTVEAGHPAWPLALAGGFDPRLLLDQAGNILALVVIVLLSTLMHASGIEVQTQQPVDVDRELTATGVGNLIAAAAGGMVGNLSLSRSVMADQFGAAGRTTGFAAAAACFGLLVAGLPLLSYLPKPMLGAMLIQVGLLLLKSWVIDAAFRLSRLDYLLVLALIAIIAIAGFVPGIVIGIVIASMIFVVSYSRTPMVRYAATLTDHRSNTDRPYQERRLLDEHGEEGWALCLQGFLFFGTASTLHAMVSQRLSEREKPPLRVLVVDFRLVTGIDASAAFGFLKLLRLIGDNDVMLIYSGLSPELAGIMESAGLPPGAESLMQFQADLDRATERAEEWILFAHLMTPTIDIAEDMITAILPDPEERRIFRDALEKVDLPEGMVVIEQGQQAEDLFILAEGRLSVMVDKVGVGKRLRSLGPGSIVGEIGMLLADRRSASVICDEDCTLFRLSRTAFATLREQHPTVADRFYCFVIKVLADRLVHANRALDQLLQ